MLQLENEEIAALEELVESIRKKYLSPEDPRFLLDAPILARELPDRIFRHLHEFRRLEPGFTVISGHPVDEERVGPTPGHWNQRSEPSPTLVEDFLLVFYSAVLGDVFGWATQQDGRVIHDVLPIRENEGEQLGSAADVLLDWHTEDAFHPHRPDWVALWCVRNPTATPTTIAIADDLEVSDEDFLVLSDERFRILPDNSHLPQYNSDSGVDFERIDRMRTQPPAVPVLWGERAKPYLRADESFWGVATPGDTVAEQALERLSETIVDKLEDVVLAPGDVVFLDNYKVVHGRKPFPARYDGTDRWLKRVCVTRDLRKSRIERGDALSQILG